MQFHLRKRGLTLPYRLHRARISPGMKPADHMYISCEQYLRRLEETPWTPGFTGLIAAYLSSLLHMAFPAFLERQFAPAGFSKKDKGWLQAHVIDKLTRYMRTIDPVELSDIRATFMREHPNGDQFLIAMARPTLGPSILAPWPFEESLSDYEPIVSHLFVFDGAWQFATTRDVYARTSGTFPWPDFKHNKALVGNDGCAGPFPVFAPHLQPAENQFDTETLVVGLTLQGLCAAAFPLDEAEHGTWLTYVSHFPAQDTMDTPWLDWSCIHQWQLLKVEEHFLQSVLTDEGMEAVRTTLQDPVTKFIFVRRNFNNSTPVHMETYPMAVSHGAKITEKGTYSIQKVDHRMIHKPLTPSLLMRDTVRKLIADKPYIKRNGFETWAFQTLSRRRTLEIVPTTIRHIKQRHLAMTTHVQPDGFLAIA